MNFSAHYKDHKWIKVKRQPHHPDKTWEERYQELESHHVAETTFLIDEIRRLAASADERDSSDRELITKLEAIASAFVSGRKFEGHYYVTLNETLKRLELSSV